MKISKKILALFLSLSVILSGFSIMAQANTETTKVSVPLSSEEFNALKAFGFIGEDIAILNNDSKITRAQFVGNLFKVAGFSEAEYSPEEIYFNDVTAENLYKDEIQYFYEAGLINGTSAKTFSPEAYITYKQAVKIILDILGYREYVVHKYGNGMDGYIALAQKLELCEGIQIGNVDAPLTAEKAVKLLYNAGITKMFEPAFYETDGDVVYASSSAKTLFEANHNLYYGEGILQSNGIVSIISYEAPDKAAVINGKEYILSGCDLTGLVGLQVQFFYEKENGNDILMWACASSKNNMIDIKASMLDRDNAKYDIDTVVYKSGKKAVELEISAYASVIYNNTLVNSYTIDDIKPEMGNIRLVENTNDKKYDLVIVEEHKNAFITDASIIGPHVANKYNEDINLPEYDNVLIIDGGKEITVSEIGKDTLITYIADRSKKNIVIYVNRESGREKLVGASVKDGKTTLKFESGSYQYAPNYENLDTTKYKKIDPRIGKMYFYYLDREGNIAEIQEQGDGILEYAYVIKAAPNTDTFAEDGSAYFRVLLTNGNFITAKSKKKIKLLENDTSRNATGMEVYNDTRLWKDGLVGGTVLPQVIRITLNSDGEIAEWEFPYDNTSNEWGHHMGRFSLDYISTSNTSSPTDGVYPIDQRYMIDGTTVCFVTLKGMDMEEPYEIMSHTQLKLNGARINVYDSNEAHVPAVISLEQTVEFSTLSVQNAFMVDSIQYKKIDGEFVKHVCGYLAGTWTEYAEYEEGIIPDDLKKGDIVKFVFRGNKINEVKRDYNINVLETTSPVISGTVNSLDNMVFSYIYSVGETSISVLTPDELVSTYGKVYPTGFSTLTVIPVIVYDARTEEITKLHPVDIAPNQAPETDGTFIPQSDDMMILINRKRNQANDIMIILR